jgi:hypothetical protein
MRTHGTLPTKTIEEKQNKLNSTTLARDEHTHNQPHNCPFARLNTYRPVGRYLRSKESKLTKSA